MTGYKVISIQTHHHLAFCKKVEIQCGISNQNEIPIKSNRKLKLHCYMLCVKNRRTGGRLLNNYMEKSPLEADSYSASKEIPYHAWNPNIHYHVHNSPLLAHILSQFNPANILIPLFKTYSDITFPYMPRSC
jgi:hypothetical protein